MLCINCNSPDVTRQGDSFTCGRCHYTWDVAHEQANAAYLASQGRKPAESIADISQAAAIPTLDDELGLTETIELREPQSAPQADEIPALPARLYEVPPEAVEIDLDAALDVPVTMAEPEVEKQEPSAEDKLIAALVKHNVQDIEALAEQAGVDLSDKRLKDEKIAALVTSGKVALDEDGVVIVVED